MTKVMPIEMSESCTAVGRPIFMVVQVVAQSARIRSQRGDTGQRLRCM